MRSPYREMHFTREEERIFAFRDNVLGSNPPEHVREFSAELIAYFELRAELVQAVSDGDFVSCDRLLSETKRSEGQMKRMATELAGQCG